MIRRFFKSRGVRKFTRSRLAILSLGIIGTYLAIALAVTFGAITVSDTRARILPDQMPGLFGSRDLDKRVADAIFIIDEWVTETVDLAIRRKQDPIEKLRAPERSFMERCFNPEMTADELDTILEDAWILFEKEIEEIDDINESPELEPQVAALEEVVLKLYPIPSGWDGTKYRFRTMLGSDRQGRSISTRAFYSVKVAFQIGLITSIFATLFGSLLGAAAAFFGGMVDHVITWLFTMLSSIPYLVLLILLLAMFRGTIFDDPTRPFLALFPVYTAFSLTFWVSPCRVIRGETLKIKELEYVQAATAIGFSRFYILLKHVIPNTAHLMFINFSLLFIGAIKSEVILSWLGLGVKGQPSWGIMIGDAANDVPTGFFWQIGAATALMFVLVLAFNILSDALQDAFDPKHVD